MLPSELNQKYELRGTLGAGAMGTVFDAVDRFIGRRVAIKVVKRPTGNDPESVEIRTRFRQEAQAACKILGASWHPPFCDDLEVVYSVGRVRWLAALIREVNPRIVLTHPPVDYMEDHTETCRLTVTAAFAKNMPNFHTTPRRAPAAGDVTIYHAMPHGLTTPLRQPVTPDLLVDTASVHGKKRAALAAHASQKEWLDATQGMDSYLSAMDELSARSAAMGRRLKLAEGWRRHLHLGFSAKEEDPLSDVLKKFCSQPRKNLG